MAAELLAETGGEVDQRVVVIVGQRQQLGLAVILRGVVDLDDDLEVLVHDLRVVLPQIHEGMDDRVVEDPLVGGIRAVCAGDVVGRERLRDRRPVLVGGHLLAAGQEARRPHRGQARHTRQRVPGRAGDCVAGGTGHRIVAAFRGDGAGNARNPVAADARQAIDRGQPRQILGAGDGGQRQGDGKGGDGGGRTQAGAVETAGTDLHGAGTPGAWFDFSKTSAVHAAATKRGTRALAGNSCTLSRHCFHLEAIRQRHGETQVNGKPHVRTPSKHPGESANRRAAPPPGRSTRSRLAQPLPGVEVPLLRVEVPYLE